MLGEGYTFILNKKSLQKLKFNKMKLKDMSKINVSRQTPYKQIK